MQRNRLFYTYDDLTPFVVAYDWTEQRFKISFPLTYKAFPGLPQLDRSTLLPAHDAEGEVILIDDILYPLANELGALLGMGEIQLIDGIEIEGSRDV